MKTIAFLDSTYIHRDPCNTDIIYGAGSCAGNFIINNGNVTYESFVRDVQLFEFYKLQGLYYRRSINADNLEYTNQKGETLSLPHYILEAIFPYYPKEGESQFFPCFLSNYPDEFDFTFALVNFDDGSIKVNDMNLFSPVLVNKNIYGLIEEEGVVFKLNLELDYEWKYEFVSSHYSNLRPLIFENIVITSLGVLEEVRQLVDGVGYESFSGGKLLGLDDHDGSLIWEQEIPNAVDNYQLFDGILYVAALHEILLIDPVTGKLLDNIDTQTSIPKNRISLGLSVYVDKDYIYYSHYDDQCLLIYNRSNLSLRRRIDLPKRCHMQEHQFFDEASGKHYFNLADRNRYVAQAPILELDPTDIDAPLVFEQEPEHSITLQASPENNAEKELLIKLNSSSLDDALRFGEIYTRDEAQRYSYNYMKMTFQERPFAPESAFNGVIRFEYSGCDQPADIVEQHLRVMEKRFAKWVDEEGFFSCIDNNKLTELKAVYISE